MVIFVDDDYLSNQISVCNSFEPLWWMLKVILSYNGNIDKYNQFVKTHLHMKVLSGRVWPSISKANCYLLISQVSNPVFCLLYWTWPRVWAHHEVPFYAITNKPTENYDACRYSTRPPSTKCVTLTYTGNSSFIWNRTSSEL